MRNWLLLNFIVAVGLSAADLPFLPLSQRIGHYDRDKLPPAAAIHGGAPGGVRYGGRRLPQAALDRFQTNLTMIDGGLMQPKGGIGYHFSKLFSMTLAYRHLQYNFDNDKLLNDIYMSGGMLGFVFRF